MKKTANLTKIFAFLGFSAILISLTSCKTAEREKIPGEKGMVVWYNKPAGDVWLDGLFIGNGYMGGNVFGRVHTERIALNESSFWSGRPHDYNDYYAYQYFDSIKELVWSKQHEKAEKMVNEHFFGIPATQQAFVPIGDLLLNFKETGDSITDYYRELDMSTGIVKISYNQGDVTMTREIFMSYPDHVMVMKISADKPGRVSLEATFNSPFIENITANDGKLTMRGTWRYVSERDNNLIARVDGKGMSFQSSLVADPVKGTVLATDSSLVISDANSVTFILISATSFVNYKDISGDPEVSCKKVLSGIKGKDYNALKAAHVKDFRNLMGRVDFKMGDPVMNARPTDERLADLRKGIQDPELWSKIYQFGRYLLVSSSRIGGQPANLQGIWNEEVLPMWGSKYTLNINYEMNYWAAEITNLSECHMPMFTMLKELAESGERTAKAYYNAGGWVAHHNTDIWRGTAPVDYANTGFWPGGGIWLCQHIWEHYIFTGDTAFLREYYPIMKGAAQFVMDVMEPEPTHGWLVIPFSISPEESAIAPNGQRACLSMTPTINIALIKDLFPHVIEAEKILGIDQSFGDRLADVLTKIPPYQLDSDGNLKTWLEDWQGLGGHNTSPVWGWFPGSSITLRGNPELAVAIEKWLAPRRIFADWGSVWTLCDWARLENGVMTDTCIQRIFRTPVPRQGEFRRPGGNAAPGADDTPPPRPFRRFRAGIANNLHNEIFNQSDASYGITAAITECLLQSHAGEISLLPALPVSWKNGSIQGIKARGGFEVAITWEDGQLTSCEIKSIFGNPCVVRYGEKTKTYDIAAGESIKITKEL
jgi:alpha-L-fucosidase 2